MNIGNSIKELRQSRGLSQIQLAETAMITQASLSNIENGKKRPNSTTLKRICNSLSISESVLYISSIEKSDISADKQEIYEQIYPIIKSLVLKLV
jgi:transcriptional regulator with XRE-family HTH domain